MNWHDRIVVDPQVLVGKPTIKGTRVSVDLVVNLLGQGWPEADILAAYPHLTHDDIVACLAYAGELLSSEHVFPTGHKA